MRGFKFLESKYVPGFLQQGTMRIGTANSFRGDDGLIGGRADTREMIKDWSPGSVTVTAQHYMRVTGQIGPDENVDPSIAHKKIVFQEGTTLRMMSDCYMICFSSKLTQLCVRRMREQFGCDACVEVRDIEALVQELTDSDERLRQSDSFQLPAGEAVWGEVNYKACNPRAYWPEGDAFTKRPEYRWQNEVRAIWQGTEPRDPFLVNVPSITALLKPVDLAKYI